jgi:2-keto-4-pentenoate hydratase/2-oxohepta-3-ene-1,7-dioic acid hydratase in catechol pathway
MKFVRFLSKNHVKYGIVESNQIQEIDDSFFGEYNLTNTYYTLQSIKILPPVIPTKIVAIGLNYKEHAKEMDIAIPLQPVIFFKPPSSIIAHQESIVHPDMANRIDYEGELAIIIGNVSKNVSIEKAKNYIAGVTICNDVTARDLQATDNQWSRAKGFDTFCPLGPYLVNELDYDNLAIKTKLNKTLVQASNTNNMIFTTSEIVSYVSQIMTLFPGDVILTGTPSGIGAMQPNDVIEIEIEGIGTLVNYNR